MTSRRDDALRIDAVQGQTPELTRDRNDPRYQDHLMQRLAPVLRDVKDDQEAIAIIKQFLLSDVYANAGMPVPKQSVGGYSDEETARDWAREHPLSAAFQQNAHAFSKGVLGAATAGPYAASRVLESLGVPRKYLINEVPDPAVAGADLRAGLGSIFEIPSTLMDPGKLERTVRDFSMAPDARSPQESREIEAVRAFDRGAQSALHEKGLPGQLATLPGDLASMFIPMGAAGKFTKGAGLLEQAFVRGNVMASTDLAKQEQGDEPELTLEQSGRRAVGAYLSAFSSVAGNAASQLPGAGATQRIISSALADASAGGLVSALTAQPIGDTLTGNFAPDAVEQSLYGAGTNLIGTIMDVPGIRAAARGDANALARIESAEAAERADASRIKSIEAEKAAAAAKAAAEAERSARLAAVLGVTESKVAPNSDRGVRAAIDVDAAMGIGRPTFFPSSASIYDAPANPSLPGRRAGGQYRPDDLLPPPAVDTPVEQTSAVDIYAKTPERMASKPKGSRSSPGGESYGLKDDLSGLKDEELDLIAGDDAAIASIAKEAKLTPKSVKIMVKREKAARAAKAPEATVQPDPVVEAVEPPRVDGPGTVYHAGELSGSGRLIHAGSEAAAKFVSEKAGGRLYRATDLPKNPVTMVDSGRAHDPARVMEDIVAMNEGDERLRLLSQRVKYELSNGGERAAEEVMIKGLEKFGYDGIKYQNVNEDPGSTSYIMFSGKGGFEAVGQDPAPVRTEIPREEIDPEDPFGPAPRPNQAPFGVPEGEMIIPVGNGMGTADKVRADVAGTVDWVMRKYGLSREDATARVREKWEQQERGRVVSSESRRSGERTYMNPATKQWDYPPLYEAMPFPLDTPAPRDVQEVEATPVSDSFREETESTGGIFDSDPDFDFNKRPTTFEGREEWLRRAEDVFHKDLGGQWPMKWMGERFREISEEAVASRKVDPVIDVTTTTPAQAPRGPWTDPIISKSGKVHSRSDNIVHMINMPDEQFRALTSPNDLPPEMAAKYAGGSRGNERFLADLQMALRRRTGQSIETGGQGDEAAPDFVIGEEGARPMLNESPDPADAAAAREEWERRTGRKAQDEFYSGIPVPKEIRDAVDKMMAEAYRLIKQSVSDAAFEARARAIGFVDAEIEMLRSARSHSAKEILDSKSWIPIHRAGISISGMLDPVNDYRKSVGHSGKWENASKGDHVARVMMLNSARSSALSRLSGGEGVAPKFMFGRRGRSHGQGEPRIARGESTEAVYGHRWLGEIGDAIEELRSDPKPLDRTDLLDQINTAFAVIDEDLQRSGVRLHVLKEVKAGRNPSAPEMAGRSGEDIPHALKLNSKRRGRFVGESVVTPKEVIDSAFNEAMSEAKTYAESGRLEEELEAAERRHETSRQAFDAAHDIIRGYWLNEFNAGRPVEYFSGIPIPKEVRDAIDAAVFQGIEMVKSGAKDAALKTKGFIESEIAILKELANGNDTSLPDLRNQMMVRYHGSGVYEEEPGRLTMAAAIKSRLPSKESLQDFSTTQLGMLKKGITDPAGALEDSYELTERIRTRAAKVLSPEARKWLSVGPRNDALRQMLDEYDSSVRVSNAELVDAAIATTDISPEDSHALWLAGETGEGKLSPELQRVVDLKDRVVDDAAMELRAIEKLSQETWNDFHRQGSRYQRRFMSKEGLIAKGLERKNQLRHSFDPYAEEALDSIASGPDGVIRSMTKPRKYRSVEDAIANKFITDHRATIQTIREVSAVAATLKLMRGIKEKFPELWTTAPKGHKGIPKKPPAGSSWVLADGPGWGALEGEWVHKDIAGSLSHLVKPRESGFYGFLKWTNSRLGGGLVMGSLGTIVKSTGFEGFMINMRNGVGLMRQRALWKDFIRAYRSYATTGKIDDTIRKLMQGGEWEVEARDYRNAVDEGLDPALRPQMKDVTSTGIKTYSKEFWNQYKAVLESYLTDVDQRGGGFWDRAQARGEAMAQGAFGFKLFNMLGMKADKLSGQGMIDLARFLDQGHRYVLLKAMTTDPGTTLPHQLYKMATGKKYRPVSDDLAIKLVKENFDMRENPAWVNALADHPFGIRFLRPRYKALHNAVVRGGVTRNPFGYAVAGNLAYIAKAAFLATHGDVDNDELSKQQQIAADAYNIPAYDLAPLFRDSKGGFVFGDMSFFSVSGLVPEVITGSEGMARSGNVATDFFRGVASQSPMLQAGMSLAGYDVYRNSAGNAPDVTAPIKALTPTAGIIAALNRIKTNSYYEKEGLQPRFSTMDQASRFFTGVATIYTGAPGSSLNRQLKSKARDNAQRREHGTHQITVANEGDGKGRRSRRRRRR